MSWSSDIRCLYCDGKLPLYRKITSGQFCSAGHRKLYWQEQERLGVERLHETHDSLREVRPKEAVEALLGYPPSYPMPEPTRTHGVIPTQTPIEPIHEEAPALAAAELYSYDADLSPQTALWAPQDISEPDHDIEPPATMGGFIVVHAMMPQPRWPMDQLVIPEPHPLATTGPVWIPLRTMAALIRDVLAAGAAAMPMAPRSYEGTRRLEPVHPAMLPCLDVSHAASPAGNALAAEEDAPRAEKLLALAAFAAHEPAPDGTRRDPWPAAPFSKVQRAHLPLATMERNVKLTIAAPPQAGLRSLAIDQVPLVHGTWIDSLRALKSEGELPRYELSTPAMRPRLRLATGSRYPVATRDQNPGVATVEPQNLQPSATAVAIPERAMAAAASSSSQNVPDAAGLIPLLAAVKPNEPAAQLAPSTQSLNLPQ